MQDDKCRSGLNAVATILLWGVATETITGFGVIICLSEGTGVGGKVLGDGLGAPVLFILTGRLKSYEAIC